MNIKKLMFITSSIFICVGAQASYMIDIDGTITEFQTEFEREIKEHERIGKELENENDLAEYFYGVTAVFTRDLYIADKSNKLDEFLNKEMENYLIVAELISQFRGSPVLYNHYDVKECFDSLGLFRWDTDLKNSANDKIGKTEAFYSVFKCLTDEVKVDTFNHRGTETALYNNLMEDANTRDLYQVIEDKIDLYSNYKKTLERDINNLIIGYKNTEKKTDEIINTLKKGREQIEDIEYKLEKIKEKSYFY